MSAVAIQPSDALCATIIRVANLPESAPGSPRSAVNDIRGAQTSPISIIRARIIAQCGEPHRAGVYSRGAGRSESKDARHVSGRRLTDASNGGSIVKMCGS